MDLTQMVYRKHTYNLKGWHYLLTPDLTVNSSPKTLS